MAVMLIMLGLVVLPYLLLGLIPELREKRSLRGTAGLALVFMFAGVGHFLIPGPLAEMIPPFVPYRVELVYLSGVVEILGGLALLPTKTRSRTGWFLIASLVILLPFNVYAAFQRIPIGDHDWGPVYLLFRVPLQVFVAAWCYWFAVRPNRETSAS